MKLGQNPAPRPEAQARGHNNPGSQKQQLWSQSSVTAAPEALKCPQRRPAWPQPGGRQAPPGPKPPSEGSGTFRPSPPRRAPHLTAAAREGLGPSRRARPPNSFLDHGSPC